MRTCNATMVVLVTAAWIGGCQTHNALKTPAASLADIGLLDDANKARRIEEALTDRDIAVYLDAKITARLPTRLAVARVSSRGMGHQPVLATLDGNELEGWSKAARDCPQIKGVHPISPLVHPQESVTMHSLRSSAARMGCELLLVYLQADSAVDNYNDAAVLYWTVVGLWLVPGSTHERLTVMQAALVDTRTGAVLGTATGDAHLKRHYAAAYKDIVVDQLSQQAPRDALADLHKRFPTALDLVIRAASAPAPAEAASAGSPGTESGR